MVNVAPHGQKMYIQGETWIGHNSPVQPLISFHVVNISFWKKGHSCVRTGRNRALRGPHTGRATECPPSYAFQKYFFPLLYYQYFTSAPRGALEVNGLPANGRRWRWDLDFSKQTWRIGAPVNKGSHTHPSVPWPWSTAGRSCFDWPTEICDGPRKTPLTQGEGGVCEYRGMFYLYFYI